MDTRQKEKEKEKDLAPVGVKNGHDEVNIQISVKISMNIFYESNKHVSKSATDKPSSVAMQQPSIRTARSLRSDRARAKLGVGVKNGYEEVNVQTSAKMSYRLSQGNAYVSKSATDKLEYGNRTTDKPISVVTQRPSMHTDRSLRSDRARVRIGRYVATEFEPSSVAT
ncbi:hypothetical protein F2Q70_00035892 [Brassica cretica]|uniref:Uncharacterized protein n=1 Tax=Brassica cretica TaxID=69181 RepID=A0A8S9JTM1_BRACR|nr:hypothetical protein F2Q70_00035892 [Brassica cretica]